MVSQISNPRSNIYRQALVYPHGESQKRGFLPRKQRKHHGQTGTPLAEIGHNAGIFRLKGQFLNPVQINPLPHTAADALGKPGIFCGQLLFDLGQMDERPLPTISLFFALCSCHYCDPVNSCPLITGLFSLTGILLLILIVAGFVKPPF